jgi:hypothetical protein
VVAVALTEIAYGKIIEKQGQLYARYKERVELLKIASAAIVVGIDGVDEELGFKRPKGEQIKLVTGD